MIVKILCDRTRLNYAAPGVLRIMASVTASEIEEKNRPPIDTVLVIDISGSMSDRATEVPGGPTKLELTKHAIKKFVEQLNPTDRVGIVIFDNATETLVPIQELTPAHRALIEERVDRMHTRGGTNLVAGAISGISLIKTLPDLGDRTRRVILFTDGQTNEGITGTANVVSTIRALLDGKMAITTMGFGAGGDYDPDLLQAIATESGGSFYHAEGEDGILSNFALELGSLKSAAATDVKIALTPVKQMPVKSVASGFPVHHEGDAIIVRIGTLYSGETKRVVLTLEQTPAAAPMPMKLFAATVKVTGVETTGAFESEEPVHVEYVATEDADQKTNPLVEEQRLLLLAGSAIRNAYELASQGDYKAAAAAIRTLREQCLALGTDDTKKLAKTLAQLEKDMAHAGNFLAKRGTIQITAFGVSTGRAAGSQYTDHLYASPAQRQTMSFMKGVDQAPESAPDEEPEEKPAPPAGTGHTMTIFEK